MAQLRIQNLRREFDGKPPTVAIDDLDLEIEDGEFVVLLGPSGCGKTTTLRCLAGLETPDTGTIELGGAVVYDKVGRLNLPPSKRSIGMVFQSYALWPHMTVRRNIAYPLKARRIKQGLNENWVQQTADIVDCGELLDRYPGQLSGGQQQRVALARGLVARPELLLFDEPLSNLDARLRDQVRAQIHELHERLKFTAVFVTHDQAEALALGDRLAIMRKGALEQYDTAEQVFEQPATEYVAEFIGMENRLILDRTDAGWTLGNAAIDGSDAIPDLAESRVALRLRPDDLQLSPSREAPTDCLSFPVTIVDSQYGGRHMDTIVSAGGDRLHARVPAGRRDGWARQLAPGDQVTAIVDPSAPLYFVPDGRRLAGAASIAGLQDTTAPVPR